MPRLETLPDKRLCGLDTLRALAIVMVIGYHFQQDLPEALGAIFRNGWTGVDLFFVLSGYLIGAQLLRPYLHGERPGVRLLLGEFYRKRAYRILPAYAVVVALYFLVPQWRESPHISPLWEFLTFTENLFIDYAHNHAFSQVWSLCVEEHFYLFLPLLVWWLLRKPAAWKTIGIMGALVAAGVGIRAYVLLHTLRPMGVDDDLFGVTYFERIYYPTWTRLDGLLAGVALALVQLFRPRWWAVVARRGHLLLGLGAGLVGVSLWSFAERTDSVDLVTSLGTVFGFPVLSLGLGLVVASAVSDNGVLGRVTLPGARMVATLAFSLYLTHKEVITGLNRNFPAVAEHGSGVRVLAYAASSMAGAAILYFGVERPFLLLRDRGRAGKAGVAVERVVEAEPAL